MQLWHRFKLRGSSFSNLTRWLSLFWNSDYFKLRTQILNHKMKLTLQRRCCNEISCLLWFLNALYREYNQYVDGNMKNDWKQNQYIGNIKLRFQPNIVIWKQWNAIRNTIQSFRTVLCEMFPMTSHCYWCTNFISDLVKMFPMYLFCFQSALFPMYVSKL